MVLNRPGETAIGNVLQTHIDTAVNILTGFGARHLGQLFDDFTASIANHAALARLSAEPVLVSKLLAFLPLVIDVGKPDQMRNDFASRIVSIVFPLQVDTIATVGNGARKLGFKLTLEVDKLAASALLQQGDSIAIIELEPVGYPLQPIEILEDFSRVYPNRIDRCTDRQRRTEAIEDRTAIGRRFDGTDLPLNTLASEKILFEYLKIKRGVTRPASSVNITINTK